MVQGLKFLSKKGFNPANKANQKRVWEAEQEKKSQAVRIQEREAQLRREREDEELARARGLEPKLGFMYAAPPGLEGSAAAAAAAAASADNKQSALDLGTKAFSSETSARDLSTQRQPGDDDAAAAFRLLLAQGSGPSTAASASDLQQTPTDPKSAFGSTVLKGSSAPNEAKKVQLSALEKAVGRKKDTSALTLDEQIQRFPALANAPRAKGMTATDVGASFKPLGTQIRNVKCLACGIWGHSKGDRECELSGWNPFAVKPPAAAAAAAAAAQGVPSEQERPLSPRNSASSLDGQGRERKKKRRRNVYSDSDDGPSLSSSSSGKRYEKDDDSSHERDRKRKHKKHKKSYKKRERRPRSRSPSSRKRKSSSKRSKADKEERRRKYGSRREDR